MNNVEERFALFRAMIESINPIYITEFNENYETIYTNNPHFELFQMLFAIETAEQRFPEGEPLHEVAVGINSPVILTNPLGMTWLSDVYIEKGRLKRIFMLGPVFLDDFSLRRIEPHVDRLQLSIPVKHQFLSLLRELPVVTLNRYYDYGIMLHRAITGKIITRSDFLYPDHYDDLPEQSETLMDYHGVYSAEQQMCRMIEEGNLQYKKIQDRLISVSDNLVKNVSGDHLRQAKNAAIVLCTIYARAAIRGGVEPETAYTMSDLYIQEIEQHNSFVGIRELIDNLAEGFTRAVSRHKIQNGISPQIRKTCDYIGIHLQEALSIQELAERLGYKEYYFSNKFKKEMGVSVREYIRKKRIERGKELLLSTNKDIQTISMELGFESVSYFGEIFKKETGMTPGEYRLHGKN